MYSKPIPPLGQRLRMEMKSRGITSAELAKRADVKTSFIYDVISGKSTNPSTVKLARVAEGLGITLASLVEPSLPESEPPPPPAAKSDFAAIPWLAVRLPAAGESAAPVPPEPPPYGFSARWLKDQLGVSPSHLRLLRIQGDSMEPALNPNDTVLVDLNKRTPTPPGLFALYDGFATMVKRLEHVLHSDPPRLRIFSDNPNYSTYENALADTLIIGRVIWVARSV